jgi:hypothetical protein
MTDSERIQDELLRRANGPRPAPPPRQLCQGASTRLNPQLNLENDFAGHPGSWPAMRPF